MTTKTTAGTAARKTTDRKTSRKRTKKASQNATTSRSALGTSTAIGADDETHKCSGACAQVLPVRKLPTTRVAGVRVSECRSCRDARTKRTKSRNVSE
jgi:hypothetical protein